MNQSFLGSSFLDREMLIRPVILRVFSSCGVHRAEFVIEPVTRSEIEEKDRNGFIEPKELDWADSEVTEAQGRAEWRSECNEILEILKQSHYVVLPFGTTGVYTATQSNITERKIAIGFAKSVNAKTIDIGIRKSLDSLKNSENVIGIFYIAAKTLDDPFANQRKVSWIDVHTPESFLRKLCAADDLVKNLEKEILEQEAKAATEHRGPVLDPDVRCNDGSSTNENGFFSSVFDWMRRDTSVSPRGAPS